MESPPPPLLLFPHSPLPSTIFLSSLHQPHTPQRTCQAPHIEKQNRGHPLLWLKIKESFPLFSLSLQPQCRPQTDLQQQLFSSGVPIGVVPSLSANAAITGDPVAYRSAIRPFPHHRPLQQSQTAAETHGAHRPIARTAQQRPPKPAIARSATSKEEDETHGAYRPTARTTQQRPSKPAIPGSATSKEETNQKEDRKQK